MNTPPIISASIARNVEVTLTLSQASLDIIIEALGSTIDKSRSYQTDADMRNVLVLTQLYSALCMADTQ